MTEKSNKSCSIKIEKMGTSIWKRLRSEQIKEDMLGDHNPS